MNRSNETQDLGQNNEQNKKKKKNKTKKTRENAITVLLFVGIYFCYPSFSLHQQICLVENQGDVNVQKYKLVLLS